MNARPDSTTNLTDFLLACTLAACASACARGPTLERVGPPLPSALGDPANDCEKREMLELVPARVTTTDLEGANTVVIETTARTTGLAAFRADGSGPIPVPDVLPMLGESELARVHEARLAPTRRRMDRVRRLRKWFGLATIVLAVGGAALSLDGLLQDRLGEAAVGGVMMGGGIVAGLVGVVAIRRAQPSSEARIDYAIESRILLQDKDDFDAAVRGVERHNRAARDRCR